MAIFLCPNNLLTVYKSAPNVSIMVAWVCRATWKTISLENDYRIEEAKRKWLGNSKKRFSRIVGTTQEITDCDRCSVTKSLAGQLPNDDVITK